MRGTIIGFISLFTATAYADGDPYACNSSFANCKLTELGHVLSDPVDMCAADLAKSVTTTWAKEIKEYKSSYSKCKGERYCTWDDATCKPVRRALSDEEKDADDLVGALKQIKKQGGSIANLQKSDKVQGEKIADLERAATAAIAVARKVDYDLPGAIQNIRETFSETAQLAIFESDVWKQALEDIDTLKQVVAFDGLHFALGLGIFVHPTYEVVERGGFTLVPEVQGVWFKTLNSETNSYMDLRVGLGLSHDFDDGNGMAIGFKGEFMLWQMSDAVWGGFLVGISGATNNGLPSDSASVDYQFKGGLGLDIALGGEPKEGKIRDPFPLLNFRLLVGGEITDIDNDPAGKAKEGPEDQYGVPVELSAAITF
ncbi:hypothetical protein HYV73_01385 [Candidatus Uhrbacteria bacterium]|nr:hypothetical protein [Candidatus Uhrbacteria bacterium]